MIHCRCRIGVVPQHHISNTSRDSNNMINDLPDEILFNIFSFLSSYEIIRSVRPVCKRWYNLSYDKYLLTDLKFGYGFGGLRFFSADLVQKLICEAPLLRSFEYYSSKPIACILWTLAENCPRLKVLELGCQPVNHYIVNRLVLKCPLITCLSLYGITGYRSEIYMPFTNLRHLRVLQIESCPWVDDSFLNALTNNLQNLATLHLLHLRNISHSSVTSLLRHVRLTLRNLSINYVNQTSFEEIFNCKLLEKCFIAHAPVSSIRTWSLLATLPNLKSVQVYGFSRSWAEPVIDYRTRMHWPNLEEVIFTSGGNISDEVIMRIAMGAPLLSVLYLEGWNNVTELGLGTAIAHCKNLTHLFLFRMKLGTHFFLALETSLPSLRCLGLFLCQINSHLLSYFVNKRRNNLIFLTEANERFDEVSSLVMRFPSLHIHRILIDCELLDEKRFPVCPKPASCIVRRAL